MKRQMDTDIKSVASRVWNRVKKAGKLAAEKLKYALPTKERFYFFCAAGILPK